MTAPAPTPPDRHAQAMAYARLPRCRACSRGRLWRKHLTRKWDYYECDKCGFREYAEPERETVEDKA